MLSILLACSRPEPAFPVVTGPKPDVVLVTLDTTRADRIGAYGYSLAQTDSIDALAKSGIRFDQAVSPLPLTIPAHATLFTGLLPHHHGIRSNGDNVLGPEQFTLAERLKKEGWATGASVAAFVTTRQWGFSQGFDAYFDAMPEDGEKNYWHTERSGDQVVDDALGWLAGQPATQPVFLWVHLYDSHFPYQPKGAYAESHKDRPYDGELAFVDDQVGRLVSAFEGRNVVFVLIGDHGEALGEHHELTHSLFNYQATQHVPWIISGAGIKPKVVSEPVSSADLLPTLLRLLGLEVPAGLDGKPQPGSPQVPYAESWQLAERFRIAPHRTVVSNNLKLIGTPTPELYDIVADPGKLTNLAADRPADVARLQQLLTAVGAAPPSASANQMDAATVSQLAALGYVSGGSSAAVDPLTLPDPKDYEAFISGVSRLERDARRQTKEEGLAALDELIAMKPDTFELRMRRIPLLGRLDRKDEAKTFLDETAKMFPEKGRVWVTLASMALREGDLEVALGYAKKGIEMQPGEAGCYEAAVEALFRLQRNDEAVELGTLQMEANPLNYGVAALLGRHYLNVKDFEKAERFLRIAVAGPNPRRAARVQLAMMALGAKARGDAFKLLQDEVKDYPANLLAHRMLARMYAEDQQWLDQKDHLVMIARIDSRNADAHRALAQCLFNLSDYAGARRALDIALSLDPEDPYVVMLHANLLSKEGHHEEGETVKDRALLLREKQLAEQAKKTKGKGDAKAEKPPEKTQ